MNNSAVAQPQEVAISVTSEQLKNLHDCRKGYLFNQSGINYEGFEKNNFVKEALDYMAELYRTNTTDVDNKIRLYFKSGYLPKWFECKVQWETCMERDMERVLRIVHYIHEQGYKVLPGTATYHISFNPISYRGQMIQAVEGTFNMMLEKDGKKIGVIFKPDEPEYSKKAKKKENLPENSIELLVSYLGAYYQYEEPFQTELWFMKNKDDKGLNLIQTYNHRPGKNVIGADFSKKSSEELMNQFIKVLSGPECVNCSLCIHSTVCRMEKEVRKESPIKAVEKVNDKKECRNTTAQDEVINFLNGEMCVIAVPGAGKTYSLVKRMITLIKKGVKPSKILFVTFTKKAAKEIEARIAKELAALGITKLPVVSTYNGFGFSVLKENPMYVGRRIKLATEVDRYSLIFKALNEAPRIKGVSYDGLYSEFGLIHSLDKWFEEIQEDGEDEFIESYIDRKDVDGIMNVYHVYQDLYEKSGFISYDMQISLVTELFNHYPVLAKRYAEKFEYIMVDEFQDTCVEQAEMIYAIARQHGNLLVVGDDDQSIYKFRGGSSRFMLEFNVDFPHAKMLYMEDNFRSTQGILAAASALINNNGKRFEKNLVSHSDKSGKPVLLKGVNREYLKNVVLAALSHGQKPGDIAILARDNKRLEEVQLLLDGIVPVATPKDYMIEDTVFLCIYDVLNLYYNGLDMDVSFYRLFGYGNNEHLLVKEDRRESFYQNLLALKRMMPIEKGSIECLADYDKKANKNPYMEIGYALVKCFERIQFDKIETGLEEIVKNVFHIEEHRVVENLIDMANDRGIVKMQELFELMSGMIQFGSTERVGYDVSPDAVSLLTCHDAKGKEFPTVIIYGVEDIDETEEEIRVLYVAMTRAMKNLYMMETSSNRYDTMKKILDYVKVMGAS